MALLVVGIFVYMYALLVPSTSSVIELCLNGGRKGRRKIQLCNKKGLQRDMVQQYNAGFLVKITFMGLCLAFMRSGRIQENIGKIREPRKVQ